MSLIGIRSSVGPGVDGAADHGSSPGWVRGTCFQGTRYISMAYIAGRPLSAYVSSTKPPSERTAGQLVWKLALALQEAHAQGIVHRDLKPANIVIDRKKEPVIMDFGLAGQMDQGRDAA